jgi:hypothetical protein
MIECTKILSQIIVFHMSLTKYSTPRLYKNLVEFEW